MFHKDRDDTCNVIYGLNDLQRTQERDRVPRSSSGILFAGGVFTSASYEILRHGEERKGKLSRLNISIKYNKI